MTRIRRLAPRVCPHCGAHNSLYINADRQLACRLCGHRVGAAAQQVAQPDPAAPRLRYPVTYGLTYSGDLDPWAKSAYHTALAHVEHDRIEQAIAAFRRALEAERDFIDAHLWLGRLLPDADARRHHYGEVLAQMPSHVEAIRELMVLQGAMSRDEADRAKRGSGQVAAADVPVEAVVTAAECPVCGGEMQANPDGSTHCRHCGYTRAPQRGDYGMKSFAMEMLRRRGQAIRWEVGERLLRCRSCNAETLLQPQALTVRCPFCGSRSVVETDALRSLVQPDSVVPFDLPQDEAQRALDEALRSAMERVKGLFLNNRVATTRMTPVFLPFWLYDLTLQVNVTVDDRRSGLYHDNPSTSYRHQQIADSAFDVPVCGVESPPRTLTDRLQRFDLARIQPYAPVLLAGATAEIYTLDFEKAALLARQRVSERMRRRHGHGTRDHVMTTVQPIVQMMQFRLALLPVYVVTVIEKDGEYRSALVHGQSGQVVLGVAARPRH